MDYKEKYTELNGIQDKKTLRDTALSYENFIKTLGVLRAPGGCSWDRVQTPLSMRGDLLEECYEAIEAINEKDIPHVKEELGDVFLNISMIAYIHEQAGDFTVSDVLKEVTEKLIRRHPHVFADSKADTKEEVLEQWNAIKKDVEGRGKNDESVLDAISKGLPPLMEAKKISKKAAKMGFDWDSSFEVKEKIFEEMNEVEEAFLEGEKEHLEEELGDVLFSVVNWARHLKVDPTLALEKANDKFRKRFLYVEKMMKKDAVEWSKENNDSMEKYWSLAKKQEKI